MRKIITAIALAVAMLFAGVGVSAPAQAVTGSTVFYSARETGLPASTAIRGTKTNGTSYTLYLGNKLTNTFRACPVGLGFHIVYRNPAGNVGTLNPGQCLVPTMVGTYYMTATSN